MISAIVPCLWVNEELVDMTIKCVSGLKQATEIDDLIIVDDGSPFDYFGQAVRRLEGYIQIIREQQNNGYATAVNSGLKVAKGEIIVVCNNDIEFIQHGWLHHLTWPLEEYDICSIRTSDSDGWETKDELEEGAKFGSLWAMRREVYEKIGGLDESFGNYFEDLDYQKRAEDAGFKVVKNHAGLVHHIGKATFSQTDPEDKNYFEAMDKFKKKWGEVW